MTGFVIRKVTGFVTRKVTVFVIRKVTGFVIRKVTGFVIRKIRLPLAHASSPNVQTKLYQAGCSCQLREWAKPVARCQRIGINTDHNVPGTQGD